MVIKLNKEVIKKLATDANLVFEIIKDGEILDLKEIDSDTISSFKEEGSPKRIWVQNVDGKNIVLEDEKIICLKYES